MSHEINNEKATYTPWLGVLLSFLMPGAGLFFAGKRRLGVYWFLGFTLAQPVILWVLSLELLQWLTVNLAILLFSVGLLISMLSSSYTRVKRMNGWIWILFLMVAVANGTLWSEIQHSLVRCFKIPTNGMAPTLQGKSILSSGKQNSGDHVVCQKFAYWFKPPKRGDIVVFDTINLDVAHPGEFYVERLVGLPGERISIFEGHLFINGKPLTDPPLFQKIKYVCFEFSKYLPTPASEFVVPEGHYFVLGDNSPNSSDSRIWGPIPQNSIIGKVTKIYWPFERFGVPQ